MTIRNYASLVVLAALLAVAITACAQAPRTPVWTDEFDGPAGSAPEASKWVFDLGATGWGNAEKQEYTNRRDNSFLDGKGHLVIRAVREGPDRYTSARLTTNGKYLVKYGRIEGRMKLPYGQGIWPAFWMLGEGFPQYPWPQCGEIDIMENIGKEPTIVHGTLHGPGYSGAKSIGGQLPLAGGGRYADDFHVYAVDWREDRIQFFVDGKRYHEVSKATLPPGGEWVFTRPHFLLLNLAVGGHWPGYPDATTTFPQELVVDWVRVYR
jgi:beta-glucanase (GH16 family)